jgi:hypothetical protein
MKRLLLTLALFGSLLNFNVAWADIKNYSINHRTLNYQGEISTIKW